MVEHVGLNQLGFELQTVNRHATLCRELKHEIFFTTSFSQKLKEIQVFFPKYRAISQKSTSMG